jgi:D-alanyl-lipoteichoic acid acyltransferase DltB (MBOAT superfamily)
MLFNSTVFLQFFGAFILLYGFCRHSLAARNVLIVAASYLFYAWWQPVEGEWDLRFLGLLFASSTFDFAVGLALEKLDRPAPGTATRPGARRALLAASVVINLGILGFFKYCNFFLDAFATAADRLGIEVARRTLEIILPVGISFYTFQSMSYAIDVYRRTIPATRNYLDFLAFVSFFPQLVAGPIERASHLLPQFSRTRTLTRPMLEEGCWLIVWGLFKKVVLADNLAPLVEMVFDHPTTSGPAVILATVAFGLQIYCDFSGYSDLARGLARVLGFDIMWNFQLPYSATSIREFWRRWHISLSTWLRDYLYISLGGNRHGAARTYLNLILTMLLGGLWHGAAWNFVLWGLWHGAGLALHRALRPGADANATTTPSPMDRPARHRAALGWLGTMAFVFYGWMLFRARSAAHVFSLTTALGNPTVPPWLGSFALVLGALATPLILMEVWQRRTNDLLAPLRLRPSLRLLLQGALVLAIAVFWNRQPASFIYFQF